MRVRRFTEKDATTALRRVKQTLGPEAVILGTRAVTDGVEITAAVDVDLVTEPHAPDAARESADLLTVVRELRDLSLRVRCLDRALAPGLAADATLGVEARALAERLAVGGVPSAVSSRIGRSFERARANGADDRAALVASLVELTGEAGPRSTARVTAFVGPTGGGKTTTIAKLAARGVIERERPALVMADTQRIGAGEQLAIYARLLDVPIATARDAAELSWALTRFADRTPILVDTAGLGGDGTGVDELRAVLAGAGKDLAIAAVVPAVASDAALERVWARMEAFGPGSCVVTKLDEAPAAIAVGWAAERGLTLHWLTTGQRVPGDLAPANGETLARWLLAA